MTAAAQMYVNKEWVETTGLPDTLNWSPGIQGLQMSVDGWSNGVYCLRLHLGSSIRTTRFVKQ